MSIRELPINVLEWLWSWLPDRCQVEQCSRRGVRGNENVIDGIVVCDYCHHRFWLQGRDTYEVPRIRARPRP